MAMVEPEIATELMQEIQKIEQGSDLERIAVISRIGMAIATSHSDEMDADAETASSSALIDLAERLSRSVNHGSLREILVKSEQGFVILQFINEEYMIFGGISNPLRIGYYMEYLRTIAHRFAFILAGKQMTEELRKEIEANRDRDFRLKQEARTPLAESFQMDKSNDTDKKAMEGVLAFLNEWGGEEETPASSNNIVSIDNDLMIGLNNLDNLAPKPISPEQVQQAQKIVINKQEADSLKKPTQPQNMEDIFAALDSFASTLPTSSSSSSSSPSTISSSSSKLDEESMEDLISTLDEFASEAKTTVDLSNIPPTTKPDTTISIESSISAGGIPEDILAGLNDLAEISTTKVTSSKTRKKPDSYPYGIPIYEGEVPPVPLDDYVSFEIGSLASVHSANQDNIQETPISSSSSNLSKSYTSATSNEIETPTTPTTPSSTKVPELAPEFASSDNEEVSSPDFDAIASEYDDVDLEIEEDAMLQALEELDFDKIAKEKK
ncbi:MAG: roadblock/LC7 domain-containing protein [Candidatus Lokiarchaeota archaeon]|nr:roadblock/LC7 domain-containing protein [Candidatus Harpocratesius repetitus]